MRSGMSWFSDADWRQNYWELFALSDNGMVYSISGIEKM